MATLNSSISDVFSVPFEHLWSVGFSGDVLCDSQSTSVSSAASTVAGSKRFVGDRANFLLKCLTQSSDHLAWPLVLYGSTGTGKTALAMSAAIRVSSDDSLHLESPVFLSAADFDRRYRQALESDSLASFRQRLLNASCLIIDDLHKLSQKTAAQNEIAGLIDLMVDSDTPLIVTMNESPAGCQVLLPKLTSRLTAGLTLPVYPPGIDARRQIIADLAEANELTFTNDAIEIIALRLQVTVPRLRHLFAQLKVATAASDPRQPHRTIDATTLSRFLKRNDSDLEQMSKLILRRVARQFDVKVADLKSGSRKQTISLARSVAVYLNRYLLSLSFVKIGSLVGHRDHSTVMHGCRKIERLLNGKSSDIHGVVPMVQRLTHQLAEQFASGMVDD